MTCLKSLIVFGERVLKTWSRSTSEVVSASAIEPPSGIVAGACGVSGGMVSATVRPAMAESEPSRIWAVVPCGSGA